VHLRGTQSRPLSDGGDNGVEGHSIAGGVDAASVGGDVGFDRLAVHWCR
jgi:hypothetical protein